MVGRRRRATGKFCRASPANSSQALRKGPGGVERSGRPCLGRARPVGPARPRREIRQAFPAFNLEAPLPPGDRTPSHAALARSGPPASDGYSSWSFIRDLPAQRLAMRNPTPSPRHRVTNLIASTVSVAHQRAGCRNRRWCAKAPHPVRSQASSPAACWPGRCPGAAGGDRPRAAACAPAGRGIPSGR
jgi:hypothetical protein